MIETRVRVVSAADGMAWVAASQESSCGACQSQSTCGISGLGKFLSRRRHDVSIPLPTRQSNAQAGDELLVCVDEAELLRAGLFAYLLPAVLAVAAAAVADASGAGGDFADIAALLAAMAGFVVGLVAARFLAPTPRIQALTLPAAHSPLDTRSTS
jgi:sigma-E factor negative regulatory protein RseC